jgi:hypothetical protein
MVYNPTSTATKKEESSGGGGGSGGLSSGFVALLSVVTSLLVVGAVVAGFMYYRMKRQDTGAQYTMEPADEESPAITMSFPRRAKIFMKNKAAYEPLLVSACTCVLDVCKFDGPLLCSFPHRLMTIRNLELLAAGTRRRLSFCRSIPFCRFSKIVPATDSLSACSSATLPPPLRLAGGCISACTRFLIFHPSLRSACTRAVWKFLNSIHACCECGALSPQWREDEP